MLTSLRAAFTCVFALTVVIASAAPPNKPPSVSITSPVPNATFSAPANITIAASASDTDGTIARVDFYQGTTLLGTRTAAPYGVTWSNVPAGSYALTAVAIDNAGASKTSSAVNITVTGARLFIATPANGATIYGGSVTVTGSFADDSNTTVLVDNGNTTRLATISNTSYSATLPLYNGPNTVRVVVARRDKTSDTATVTVIGNTAPLVTFTAPATTSFDAPANVGLVVDAASPASTISKVEFFRGTTLLSTSMASPYQFSWNNVPSGNYTITATATDANGYSASTYLPITVSGPNVPPTVALTAPTNGATFTAPATISLSANAADKDGSITLVEFLQNGLVIGSTNVYPYGMTWSNIGAGSYTLTARATDNRAGTMTSAPVNITVGNLNSPPNVSLTSPNSGASFVAPANVSLVATASDSDGTIARVEFYEGTTLLGSANAQPYSFNWANVGPGNYTLTAKAIDDKGASTTSLSIGIVVTSNAAPSIALTSPSQGATYSAPAAITLIANASDSDGSIARVDFYQGATLLGSASSAPYTYSWTNVSAGSYALTARAIDNQGAATPSSVVNVTVSGAAFAITSPTNNAFVNSDVVNVTGTVQAPSNSGITVNGVIAAIDATGHFFANFVPLASGSNTITATLTTLDGQVTTQAVNVTSNGPAPVKIGASATQGMSPLSVRFEVRANVDVNIRKLEIDGDADGNIEQTITSAPWTASTTYSGNGNANAVVRVTDANGTVYSQTIPIVIFSSAVLDQTLRAVWTGMKTALTGRDKPTAMRYLDASAQQRYGPAFDILLADMPQIVGTFSDLQSVSLSDGLGEYAINRTINGEDRIFLIYFGRNGDGVWRIGSM